ncbi:MAG: 50S ribosomal protein L22 [Bryobacteraceae bacterium]
MLVYAKARFVRTSPRKARLVIDAIRGKYVKEALAILQFTPNYAARLIEKVVKSAAANAENNFHMDGENLKVSQAMVDGGPNVMKRLRHAPMGRGYRIVKRMSHITIAVEETVPRPEKKGKKGVARTARPARRGGATPAPAGRARKPAEQAPTTAPGEPEEVNLGTTPAEGAVQPEGQTEAKGGE